MHAKDSDFVAKWNAHFGLQPKRVDSWYGATVLQYVDGRPAPISISRETARAIYDDVVSLRACAVKDHADNQAVRDAISLLDYLQMGAGLARQMRAHGVMQSLADHLRAWMSGNDWGMRSLGSTGEAWEDEKGSTD